MKRLRAALLVLLGGCAPPAEMALPVARPIAIPVPPTPPAPPPPPVEPAPPPAPEPPPPPPCQPISVTAEELGATDLDVPIPPLVDPTEALGDFRRKLARLIRGEATEHVRIAVFGDSNLTTDRLTGEMRRVAQRRLGDGGHGFVAVGKPWDWYRHLDIDHGLWNRAWASHSITTSAVGDRLYGFAGIAADSRQRGAKAWIGTAGDDAPVGRAVSRVEIYYLSRPEGGSFAVDIDGARAASVSTRAPLGPGYRLFNLPDGPHRIELTALDKHPVRLFGVTFERAQPSLIVDSLGVGGSSCFTWNLQDPALLAATIRHRGYDAVLLLVGTNTAYPGTYRECIRSFAAGLRTALGGAPVILMSPPDRPDPAAPYNSSREIREVARIHREVAEAEHLPFWDFREAMGGEGSMARFQTRGLGWTDGAHFTPEGAGVMGRRMLYALWRDTAEHSACR